MAVNPIERSLGLKYPNTPDELVVFVQRVLGPLVAEIKTRFNEVQEAIGVTLEADEATLTTLDTTNMRDAYLAIAADTRGLFSLDKGGVAGLGDLDALPTGRWKFIQTL